MPNQSNLPAVISRLRRARLFQQWAQDIPEQLASLSNEVVYPKGQTIVTEGAELKHIYFLLYGVVNLKVGNEPLLSLRRCGDIFGEEAVILKKPSGISVIAETDVRVLQVDYEYVIRQQMEEGADQLNQAGSHAGYLSELLNHVFSVILTEKLILTTKRARKHDSQLSGLQQTRLELQEAQRIVEGQSRQHTNALLEANQQLREELRQRIKTEHELLRAKQQAEDLNQLKTQIFANLSNDLLTPVETVISLADMTLETKLSRRQFQHISLLRQSAEGLSLTLNSLLYLARIEIGNLKIHRQDTELQALMESVLQPFRNRAREKGLTLAYQPTKRLIPLVNTDPLIVQLIMQNLLDNALKFTERGGIQAGLETEILDQSKLRLHGWVSDSGIGIPQPIQQKIMQRSLWRKNSVSGNLHGSGIGLETVKQLVQVLGGQVWLDSQESEGSTFHFNLMCETSATLQDEPIAQAVASKPVHMVKQIHVLLAEDNRTNLTLISMVLEDLGCQVSTARDGVSAAKVLKEQVFDLILLDVNMPELGGPELTRQLKDPAHGFPSANQKAPVIALTALLNDEIILTCEQAGMLEAVAKPVDASTLSRLIDYYVQFQPLQATEEDSDPLELDCSHLLQAVGGSWRKLQTIIETFLEDLPNQMQAVENAWQQKDYSQLERGAHSLKGAVGNFGAEAAQQTAYQLERFAAEGQIKPIPGVLARLKQELNRLTTALETLEMPVNEDPEPLQDALQVGKDTQAAVARKIGKGWKVLVSEDNYVSRQMLVAFLTDWGFEVIATENGRQAWHILKQDDCPQLVIMDWIMPEMDGDEVCRKLRGLDRERYVYIMLLTSRRLQEDRIVGLEAGADDYITKPFNQTELLQRISVGIRLIQQENAIAEQRDYLREGIQIGMQQNAHYVALIHFMAELRDHDNEYSLFGAVERFLRKNLKTEVQFWELVGQEAVPLGDIDRDISEEKRAMVRKAFGNKSSISFVDGMPRFIKEEGIMMEIKSFAEQDFALDLLPLYISHLRVNLISTRRRQQVITERARYQRLMQNILPVKIAEELMKQGHTKPRFYPNVTVVFTDFADFTRNAKEWDPNKLVRELSRYFDYFDRTVEFYQVEKLKTMGDGYMFAGGLPEHNHTHAIDCVMTALEILKFTEMVRSFHTSDEQTAWKIRIGIHSGPVMAGVIGSKKFAYDIWGDTVNTASRMENSCQPGEINISEVTYLAVKDYFACTFRGTYPVKGIGEMKMYRVDGLLPEYRNIDDTVLPNEAFYKQYEVLKGKA